MRGILKQKYSLQNFDYEEIIGIHGAEQYFREVFRRFVVRSQRNPEWIKRYDFLQKKNQQRFLQQNELDRYIASLGWYYGVKHDIDKVDARNINFYQKILKEFEIQERNELDMTLGEFYEEYLQKRKDF